MTRNRQALTIVWLALCLLAAFGLLAAAPFWRAELAETNFQANLIRLQGFLFDKPPQTVLVGSSITGRLVPSYFQNTSLAPLANLGLDGSGTLFGLGLALSNPPPVVVLEENTFLRPANDNEQLLEATLREPTFHLAKYLPILRARSRPSSVLYTWLKQHSREGGNSKPENELVRTNSPGKGLRGPSTTADPDEVRKVLRTEIGELIKHGSRVVLMRLPSQRATTNDPAFALSELLAREFKLLHVDLDAECTSRGRTMTFTDGIHLSVNSAREASRVLAELISEKKANALAKRGDKGLD
jgi:hypothetical protein